MGISFNIIWNVNKLDNIEYFLRKTEHCKMLRLHLNYSEKLKKNTYNVYILSIRNNIISN